MTRGQIDYCYFWLLENELFTEAELYLLTHINGYKMETLNDAVFCRYGCRTVDDLIEEVNNEDALL
jgi:hypothetical protein